MASAATETPTRPDSDTSPNPQANQPRQQTKPDTQQQQAGQGARGKGDQGRAGGGKTSPVTDLNDNNFADVVNDADRDVLVEFYAPWCGHCRRFAPILEEIGRALADDDSVVIARMDATANTAPAPFDVPYFPSIYFVPAGGDPVLFSGDRTLDNIISFMRDNGCGCAALTEE